MVGDCTLVLVLLIFLPDSFLRVPLRTPEESMSSREEIQEVSRRRQRTLSVHATALLDVFLAPAIPLQRCSLPENIALTTKSSNYGMSANGREGGEYSVLGNEIKDHLLYIHVVAFFIDLQTRKKHERSARDEDEMEMAILVPLLRVIIALVMAHEELLVFVFAFDRRGGRGLLVTNLLAIVLVGVALDLVLHGISFAIVSFLLKIGIVLGKWVRRRGGTMRNNIALMQAALRLHGDLRCRILFALLDGHLEHLSHK